MSVWSARLAALLRAVKYREPIPSLRLAESVTPHEIVWRPFVSARVLIVRSAMGPRPASRFRNNVPAPRNAVDTSSSHTTPGGGVVPTVPRHRLYWAVPTAAPSMNTVTVEPSTGTSTPVPGSGVRAQPKLCSRPETVAPCVGVSIAPKGLAIVSFATVTRVGV